MAFPSCWHIPEGHKAVILLKGNTIQGKIKAPDPRASLRSLQQGKARARSWKCSSTTPHQPKSDDRQSLAAPDFLCKINILRIICWKIPSHPTDKIKRDARRSRLSLSPPSQGQETALPPAEKFPHYFVWGAACKADTDLKAWSAFESFKSLNYLDFYIQIAVIVKDTSSSKASAVVGTQVAFFFFFLKLGNSYRNVKLL